MGDVSLGCTCGKVKGVARDVSARTGTRIVCYCKGCQVFANWLGRHDDILDKQGGTDILQIAPAQITLTQGADQLRSLRLTRKGAIRWYAECCKSPVGNTISGRVPFVGVFHTFMNGDDNRKIIGKTGSL